MTAKEPDLELKALSSFVSGVTLEMGAFSRGQLPGTTLIDRERTSGIGASYETLTGHADASVDTIVSRCGLETVLDPWRCLREWHRVLKSDGVLALLCADAAGGRGMSDDWRQTFTAVSLTRLLRSCGFETERCMPVVQDQSFLVVAKRHELALVRSALAPVSAELANAATASPKARAELYFQIGTILLRSGDAELAERCFKALLVLEPGNAEGLFGLGMCYGTQHLWPEALTELQRTLALDPSNGEARRWLELAKQKVGGRTGPRAAALRV